MKKFYFLIVAFFSATMIYSQNDLCANATVLVPGSSCTTVQGSFNGATISTPAPSCAVDASQDVWFQFVATEKMHLITLSGTAGVSNGFAVYETSCNGAVLFCRNANNTTGSSESTYYNNFIIGNTYFIRVFNAFIATTQGTFTICVQSFPAPANDLCANAVTITPNASCVYTPVTFSGATLDGSSFTSCSPNPSQDVWYKFTATNTSMTVTISTVSDVSNAFEIYDGSCSGSMLLCRNANGNGAGESYTYNQFVSGNLYYVRVSNAYITPLSVSNFGICVQDATLNLTENNHDVFEVYPNPTESKLYVSNVNEEFQYQLVNTLGQVIKAGKFDTNEIDLQSLESGMYLLKITNQTKSIVKRIVKK